MQRMAESCTEGPEWVVGTRKLPDGIPEEQFGKGLPQRVAEYSPLARRLLAAANNSPPARKLESRVFIAALVGGIVGMPAVREAFPQLGAIPLPDVKTGLPMSRQDERWTSLWTVRGEVIGAGECAELLHRALAALMWHLQVPELQGEGEAADFRMLAGCPTAVPSKATVLSLQPGHAWSRQYAQLPVSMQVDALRVEGRIEVAVSRPKVQVQFELHDLQWENEQARQAYEARNTGRSATAELVEKLQERVAALALVLDWSPCAGKESALGLIAQAASQAWEDALSARAEATRVTDQMKAAKKAAKDSEAVAKQASAQVRALTKRVETLEADLVKAGRYANSLEAKLRDRSQATPGAERVLDTQLQAQLAQLQQERDVLAAANDALRQDVHALQLRLLPPEQPPEEAPSIPDPECYAGLADWAATHFAGRLVLTKRAAKAASRSIYHDPSVVYRALRCMAEQLYPVLSGETPGAMPAYQDALTRICCEDTAVGEALNDPRFVGEYQLRHAGRDLVLDRHVKRGAGFDPRTCLRIYYTWDERKQVLVVGHLTQHLSNRQS